MSRALLISAYDARSHARWREGLVRHCDGLDWTVVALPPRHFSWRVRGNALSLLAPRHDEALSRHYDVIVATSMTDVTTLRAVRPALRGVPALLYFHENQFAYPNRTDGLADIAFASILNALAAECVVFNSTFNRDTCLAGARDLLARMPDEVPDGVLDRMAARATVLPVPLEPESFVTRDATDVPGRPLTLAWNHRWEHDKAPERLLGALGILRARGVPFRLHVLGQQFRREPAPFASLRESFAAELGTIGFVADDAAYRAVLAESDIVLSTALQDFQGLSILDGIAAGCRPAVPDRLAYREFVPARYRYASWPHDPAREAQALADMLTGFGEECARGWSAPAPDVRPLAWTALGEAYRTLLERTISARP